MSGTLDDIASAAARDAARFELATPPRGVGGVAALASPDASAPEKSTPTTWGAWIRRHSWIPLTVFVLGILLCAAVPGVASFTGAEAGSEAPAKVPEVILLVVGDWGRLGAPAQIACADAMESTAAQLRSEVAAGADGSYLGVVTTGDNFYEDGLRASSDAQFAASFSDVYQTNRTRPALFGLTWHGVVGNRDYHLSVAAQVDELPSARPEWDVMVSGYRAWGPGGGSGSAGGGGGGGPPSSPPALGACFVDTTPWIHSYRDHVPKSHYASLVTLLAAHGGSWHAWEAEALDGLEACLRASDATWRVVVGHHPIVSHQAHRGSEPALARVRELVERFGAAAYFNGHAHGLQHVAPASMPTTPGGEAPRTTRYVTSGAGSTVRAMENATRLPEELTFFRDDGPGFVVVRANARRLSITHHAAPGGEALFQETLVA